MDATSGVGIVLYLVFALLVLFVSIVWLIFPFIVNARLSKLITEVAEGNQEVRNLLLETAKTNQHLESMVAASKKASSTPTSHLNRKTAPVPLTVVEPLTMTVSQNGKNIGEFTFNSVKQMLKNKTLTLQDMYFDKDTNEWIALELHPSFY